jgi:hypothetical protein
LKVIPGKVKLRQVVAVFNQVLQAVETCAACTLSISVIMELVS